METMVHTGPAVSDAARTRVGTVTAEYTSEPISLRHVREYIAATGGDLLEWPTTAPARHRPVPPLFFHAACRPVAAEASLEPDGQYPFLGVTGVTGETMAGGNRFEILEPVYVGDVLRTTERLVAIDERAGRSGPLVITTTETEYRNQDGSLVARYRQTIIFR
jgi:hydroxyacyl-ACP dehydratase HTD2-like protein with hotdog domain